MLFCARVSLAFFAALLTHSSAQAETNQPRIIDSVYAGVSIHDVGGDSKGGLDGNIELQLSPVFGRHWTITILPTIGASVSLNGEANTAYVGATARYMLTNSLFIEGLLGFTLHDADTPTQRNGIDLGCSVLFREAIGLGYRHGSHTIALHGSHSSHGQILCSDDENDGLTNIGVRYGYHF